MKVVLYHFLLYLIIAASSTVLAQSGHYSDRQQFINEMIPAIRQVNQEILAQRTGIYNIFTKFKIDSNLPEHEKILIYRYLKFFRCNIPDDTTAFELTSNHFKQLLSKVDVIPVKLVLAQSALESNWGKSRFAVEGNNYFGIRCYSVGCGLTPADAGNENFKVKSYPEIIDGLRDYFRLLNSSRYYERFRELRMINRMNGKNPVAEDIVYGLENFSSLRQQYIEKLMVIMKINFNHY